MKNEYIKNQKIALRKKMIEQRNKMPQSERARLSEKICTQLWTFILENEIKIIHSYLSMRSEVDVFPLLQKALDRGLTIVAPKTLKKRQLQHLVVSSLDEMEKGIFNTYHPKDAIAYKGNYDLIIVAGLAFDRTGYRLGYGGGYYDTFLKDHENAKKIGICYPFQLIEKIPIEEHDVQLDLIIS